MYEAVPLLAYRQNHPDDVTHPGAEGWNQAPFPGWGVNAAQAYPRQLGEEELPVLVTDSELRQAELERALRAAARDTVLHARLEEPLVGAIEQAAKKVVFTTAPKPVPAPPYPVHRDVPGVMFDQVTAAPSAPWGTFPKQRSYDLGAYYQEVPVRPVSGLGAYYQEVPVRPVSGLGSALLPVKIKEAIRKSSPEAALKLQQMEASRTTTSSFPWLALGIGVGSVALLGTIAILATSKPKVRPNRRVRRNRTHLGGYAQSLARELGERGCPASISVASLAKSQRMSLAKAREVLSRHLDVFNEEVAEEYAERKAGYVNEESLRRYPCRYELHGDHLYQQALAPNRRKRRPRRTR